MFYTNHSLIQFNELNSEHWWTEEIFSLISVNDSIVRGFISPDMVDMEG